MAATLHRYRAQYCHLKREMYFMFSHLVDVFFFAAAAAAAALPLAFCSDRCSNERPVFLRGGVRAAQVV